MYSKVCPFGSSPKAREPERLDPLCTGRLLKSCRNRAGLEERDIDNSARGMFPAGRYSAWESGQSVHHFLGPIRSSESGSLVAFWPSSKSFGIIFHRFSIHECPASPPPFHISNRGKAVCPMVCPESPHQADPQGSNHTYDVKARLGPEESLIPQWPF